jgi:two-component system, LytTR family, sensor kinase
LLASAYAAISRCKKSLPLATMSPHHIPYRSLWRTALLTSPMLALGLASPIFIASGLSVELAWPMLPGSVFLCLVAWSLNIGFLKFRAQLGRWKWVQVLVIGGAMIGLSYGVVHLITPYVPPHASRLTAIRFVNAFALNAIIYALIDLRLISESRARLAEENAQLRLSSLETQYQMLKDQVNPHFLFNALGTARALARRDPALTEAYIIRLSDFLRVTLQDARDHVALADELKLVRDYVELQKMRFHDALVFECSPETLSTQYKLPFFSLLTLVENAVKHNMMTAESPLYIRITREGARIAVWNNRQAKALHSPSNGSGLSNLQKRCKILGHGDIAIVESAAAYTVSFDLLPA